MQQAIRSMNEELLLQVARLRAMLSDHASNIPAELHPYLQWATSECQNMRGQIEANIANLVHLPHIEEELISNTQSVTRSFHLFSKFAGHIFRASDRDRLCLKFLAWMHSQSQSTDGVPFALTNEDFGVLPVVPPVYSVPSALQHGLLYLPLFLHEFGHLLYQIHESEMDELVKSLQKQLSQRLQPAIRSDDLHSTVELQKRSIIEHRWFEWTQEFFCDAVGLVAGGAAFCHATSQFSKWLGRDELFLPEHELQKSSHPVTWLRIRVLTDRADRMGISSLSDAVRNEWRDLAHALGIQEDYFGFFEAEFMDAVQSTIDDMLVEASPPRFAADSNWLAGAWQDPIQLLNQAWHQRTNAASAYQRWEEHRIEEFMTKY